MSQRSMKRAGNMRCDGLMTCRRVVHTRTTCREGSHAAQKPEGQGQALSEALGNFEDVSRLVLPYFDDCSATVRPDDDEQ
ncbi:hypothetical protein Y032_0449g1650 [Ancylostoma ceylanicum]|uniref:Uncharacterized protein n=1 Tax=Ancylostoma ceylanicum TaxID=53326 RepID=A0A016X0I3_9BILA|nr:hypothetical protein Y032_0449g1650 [Ancylostoma ceylanicum]